MATPKAKPYKLKPTDGVMTRDDVSLWEYTLLAACRQVTDWVKFLPGKDKETWQATDDDSTNGLTGEDATATAKIQADFADFLTCVATHCPTGFMDTVMRESTSFKGIVQQIKTTFGLDSKGEKFLSCIDIKLEFSEKFTYEMGYMAVKDFFMSSLLPKRATFKGKQLDTAEILSPLAENFIMKEFLTKVHPKLPEHVKNTKGYLFTTEKPTLACNKAKLIDLMDTMLQEIENLDNMSAGNLSVGQVRSFRGRGRPPMPRFPYSPNPNFRGLPRPPIRGARHPFPNTVNNRFQFRGRREDCTLCLEARRFDSSKGHETNKCPFPSGFARPYQSGSSNGSNFKVLLVSDQQGSQSQIQSADHLQHLPLVAPDGQDGGYQDEQYYDPHGDTYYGGYDESDYTQQFGTNNFYPSYQGGAYQSGAPL